MIRGERKIDGINTPIIIKTIKIICPTSDSAGYSSTLDQISNLVIAASGKTINNQTKINKPISFLPLFLAGTGSFLGS